MKIDIRAGKRVLVKDKGQWHVGTIMEAAGISDKGLFVYVEDSKHNMYRSEINDLFLDATQLGDLILNDPDTLMTKEKYIDIIENDEDFDRKYEFSFVSDGEYYYYTINKYTREWLEKQPFDYVVRMRKVW